MGADIAATTYLPFCFKNIVEGLEGGKAFHGLFALTGIFLGTTFVVKVASFLQDLLFYPIINVTIRECHYRTAAHIHAIALTDYHTLSISEVISFQKRIGFSARFFLRALLVSILPTLLKFLFAFAIIWSLDIFRFGLLIGIFTLFGLFYSAMGWYLRMRTKAWRITDKVTMALGDSILNTKLVRFYKAFELRRLRRLVQEESETWFLMTFRMDMVQVFLGGFMALIMGGLIGFGAYKVHEGTLTLGQFILLNGQLTALFIPIKQTLLDLKQIFEASVDFEKIADIFDIPKEKKEVRPVQFDSSHQQCITFNQVSFAYKEGKNIFKDLSFQIESNKKVLFYGVSGAGKSTLLGLMTGLLTPQSGIIQLFGEDIFPISLQDIGRVVHFIPQDNQLFNGTFYENLTFGVESLKAYEIDDALQAAELTSLIKCFPQGLHTIIGEMGAKLSGGEKQRLALARALLLKPQILIFDETTNAMDKQTEKKVFENVGRQIKTILFISHRKTVIHDVDHFLEVKEGQIFEYPNLPNTPLTPRDGGSPAP